MDLGRLAATLDTLLTSAMGMGMVGLLALHNSGVPLPEYAELILTIDGGVASLLGGHTPLICDFSVTWPRCIEWESRLVNEFGRWIG